MSRKHTTAGDLEDRALWSKYHEAFCKARSAGFDFWCAIQMGFFSVDPKHELKLCPKCEAMCERGSA